MTAIPVVWVSYHKPDIIARGYWDQGLLERILDRRAWRPVCQFTYRHCDGFDDLPPDHDGAVVVIPARHHAGDVDRINADLARLRWCLVVLTGDEAAEFPWRDLTHPRMELWVMTPRPGVHGPGRIARFLGDGWHPDTPDVLAACGVGGARHGWMFAGQVTHPRRVDCVAALRALPPGSGYLLETPGFTQGIDRHEYLRRLAAAKIAPCPGGPETPDTFRLYEALEAGCLPLADAYSASGSTGYWELLFGDPPPFPVVEDWADLPAIMADALAAWPGNANRAVGWWQTHKRALAYDLDDAVAALGGGLPAPSGPQDQITVLIPTSVIPAHPDTSIIEETVGSIRTQPGLGDAEIFLMVDGVRPEQAADVARYDEYVHRLVELCARRWHNVVPLIADRHFHQGNLTRAALPWVRTPTVLFVEHDTPLCGDIPWEQLVAVVASGDANLVRLHHEARVHPDHMHLMVDKTPRLVRDVPLMRCAQWSQRPHLASTEFYRDIIARYFGRESRTMIEDVMHGVLDQAWREHRVAGWSKFKVWLYAPPGDMKRSRHTDGRGPDSKFDMWFAYDGPTPEGAPAPTAGRVD